jgi:endonuclease G
MVQRRRKSRKSSPFPVKTVLFAACVILILIGWFGFDKTSAGEQPQTSAQQKELSYGDSLCKVVVPAGTVEEILNYPGFTVSFNKKHHQPNWVAWELTREETKGTLARSNNFQADESVEGCATLADYHGSGYDRGHMAPAADMKWSEASMNACFYLTNMSPQAADLNQKAWGKLEDKCRVWAQRDSAIIIVCGPVLTDRITKTIGDTRVSVPTRYFKVVLAPYANPPRAIGFIMPNSRVEGGMQQAAVSVDEVERITGFDFFSALPDDIENEVEAQCNFTLWSRLK